MYATRHALPGGSRPISFGAALGLSSAIIAALIFSSPDLYKRITAPDTITFDVPIKEPPPEEKVKPKEQTQEVRQTPIFAPEPQVPVISDPPPFQTTNIITDRPPIVVGTTEGLAETPRTPPLPPLLAAETDPRFNYQPDYPASEIRAQREGTVSVRVRIGSDGRVKAVEKIRATSDAFYEATRRQALSRWRFRPATRGGVAEESWKTMNLRFTLTEG